MVRLIGFDAIEFAEQEGLSLNKSADPIDGPVSDLSVAEAEAIADSEPELIWLEVSDDDYYGEPKNMMPGAESRPDPRSRHSRASGEQRRAGQRPDELLPGESDGEASPDSMRGDAAGSPAGGLDATGLAGTTRGDGAPNDLDAENALGSDVDNPEDDLSDTVEGTHPQSGRSGGAVGGTPAGKRVTPR